MVSLPNRGVAQPAQMELQLEEDATFEEKIQLSPEKMQLSDTKAQQSAFSDDWELKYFHDVVIKELEGSFRGKTLEKIEELFSRYRYSYTFNRSNIAELFGITENRASGIIKDLIEKGIIVKIKNGVYSFSFRK